MPNAGRLHQWVIMRGANRRVSKRAQDDKQLTEQIRTYSPTFQWDLWCPSYFWGSPWHRGFAPARNVLQDWCDKPRFMVWAEERVWRQHTDLWLKKKRLIWSSETWKVDKPNKLWVADITYIPHLVWLSVSIRCSWCLLKARGLAGQWPLIWTTQLVLDALDMALWKPTTRAGDSSFSIPRVSIYILCFWSTLSQGWGSGHLWDRLRDCFDNALCESFFATLECELIDRHSFPNHSQAKLAIFEYIEGWYNPHRRHSAIRYLSPITYEKLIASGWLGWTFYTIH